MSIMQVDRFDYKWFSRDSPIVRLCFDTWKWTHWAEKVAKVGDIWVDLEHLGWLSVSGTFWIGEECITLCFDSSNTKYTLIGIHVLSGNHLISTGEANIHDPYLLSLANRQSTPRKANVPAAFCFLNILDTLYKKESANRQISHK